MKMASSKCGKNATLFLDGTSIFRWKSKCENWWAWVCVRERESERERRMKIVADFAQVYQGEFRRVFWIIPRHLVVTSNVTSFLIKLIIKFHHSKVLVLVKSNDAVLFKTNKILKFVAGNFCMDLNLIDHRRVSHVTFALSHNVMENWEW